MKMQIILLPWLQTNEGNATNSTVVITQEDRQSNAKHLAYRLTNLQTENGVADLQKMIIHVYTTVMWLQWYGADKQNNNPSETCTAVWSPAGQSNLNTGPVPAYFLQVQIITQSVPVTSVYITFECLFQRKTMSSELSSLSIYVCLYQPWKCSYTCFHIDTCIHPWCLCNEHFMPVSMKATWRDVFKVLLLHSEGVAVCLPYKFVQVYLLWASQMLVYQQWKNLPSCWKTSWICH